MSSLVVCLEGNIGSGKSTLLSKLANSTKVKIHKEPVDRWQNDVDDFDLLSQMYESPARFSHLFQSYAMLTMAQLHQQVQTNPGTNVLERSIVSGRRCFVQNLRNRDLMAPSEFAVINSWFDLLEQSLHIDLFVYLRTSPKTALSRIKQRNKGEECKIDLDYLQDLHELHENWLIKEADKLKSPVLVLDGDVDLEEDASVLDVHGAKILRAVDNLHDKENNHGFNN